MFYQTYTAHKAAEITPPLRQRRNGAIFRCVTSFAASAFHLVVAVGLWKCTAHVLSLVTLTFDLDIQTRPSEDQAHLPREFDINPFSRSQIFEWQTKKILKLITDSTKNTTLLACSNKENGYVQFITVHHANDSTHHSTGHFRDKTFHVINHNRSKNKIHNNQKIHQQTWTT